MKATLEALYPKLQRIARTCPTSAIIDEDDCAQEMALRMWKRLLEDPHRQNDPTAYLVCDAKRNGAWKANRHANICGKWVIDFNPAYDDGEEEEDYIPDSGESPEDAVIRKENRQRFNATASQFTAQNREVIRLLALGEDESKIALALGVSRSAISQRKQTIRKYLLEAGIRPQ